MTATEVLHWRTAQDKRGLIYNEIEGGGSFPSFSAFFRASLLGTPLWGRQFMHE